MKVDGHASRMEKFGTREEKTTWKTYFVVVFIKMDFQTKWKNVDRNNVAQDEANCANGNESGCTKRREFFHQFTNQLENKDCAHWNFLNTQYLSASENFILAYF